MQFTEYNPQEQLPWISQAWFARNGDSVLSLLLEEQKETLLDKELSAHLGGEGSTIYVLLEERVYTLHIVYTSMSNGEFFIHAARDGVKAEGYSIQLDKESKPARKSIDASILEKFGLEGLPKHVQDLYNKARIELNKR